MRGKDLRLLDLGVRKPRIRPEDLRGIPRAFPGKAYPEGISSLLADPHTEQLREQPPGLSDVSASRMSHKEPLAVGTWKT